jgi:hypothetical protein
MGPNEQRRIDAKGCRDIGQLGERDPRGSRLDHRQHSGLEEAHLAGELLLCLPGREPVDRGRHDDGHQALVFLRLGQFHILLSVAYILVIALSGMEFAAITDGCRVFWCVREPCRMHAREFSCTHKQTEKIWIDSGSRRTAFFYGKRTQLPFRTETFWLLPQHRLFAETVLPASRGCDFDFLTASGTRRADGTTE